MNVTSLHEAVASIGDGALVGIGGFQLNRAPMALAAELVRQGRRHLKLVGAPCPLPFDLLVGAGAAGEATSGFFGFQYEGGFVVAPSVRRAIERGELRHHECDVYEIIQGLRAASLGLPFLPAPGLEASDYARVNGTPVLRDPGSGAGVPIARAIRPEVALIHAQEADRDGNLMLADPHADTLLARASGRVIASVERVVDRVPSPSVPGDRVDRLVLAPGGASPTSCRGHYGYDPEAIAAYIGGAAPAPGPAAGPAPDPERVASVDRLVAAMARSIGGGEVVTTGVASALPMLAIALARALRAPGPTYINCVGAIDPVLKAASYTSVDVRLLDECRATLELPDLFDLARLGRIDTMFFGAAQVDEAARLNLTCIGDYARPRVKLAGPAGSSSMRPYVRRALVVVPRHSPRTLVPRVDFATSVASPQNRETLVLTDLAAFRLEGGRLRLAWRHAGVGLEAVRAATGFPVEGDEGAIAPPPSRSEMDALNRLDPAGIRYRLA